MSSRSHINFSITVKIWNYHEFCNWSEDIHIKYNIVLNNYVYFNISVCYSLKHHGANKFLYHYIIKKSIDHGNRLKVQVVMNSLILDFFKTSILFKNRCQQLHFTCWAQIQKDYFEGLKFWFGTRWNKLQKYSEKMSLWFVFISIFFNN